MNLTHICYIVLTTSRVISIPSSWPPTLTAATGRIPSHSVLSDSAKKTNWKSRRYTPTPLWPSQEGREGESVTFAMPNLTFSSFPSCIGKRFAMIEAVLSLAAIVCRFDISSSMEEEAIDWHFIGTLKPQNFGCSFTARVNRPRTTEAE